MKKIITLPFEDTPYSLMYHGSAFPLGIIQGNATKDLTPWLSGKYINCWFAPTWGNKFAHYVSDHWATGDKILFQQRVDILYEQYNFIFKKDVIFLLRNMINMGFYPHGEYNEEYIPGKKMFRMGYFLHDYMLIGYNDTTQSFTSVGYLEDKLFQRYSIPYEYMKLAIQSVHSSKISINFWKYNEDSQFLFDINRLITELTDYLHSTTSAKIYTKNRDWGITAIKELGKYITIMCNDEKYIDHRYTRGIMEHKFFMQLRIQYLSNIGYLQSKEYIQKAQHVYLLSQNIHLLGLKYRTSKNATIAKRIQEIFNEIILIECNYLPSVLSDLTNY